MLFIDSADPKEIKRWFDAGVVSGVTTNPILIQRVLGKYPDDDALKAHIEQILAVSTGAVSVQLTSETAEQMIMEAQLYRGWGDRIVIKVPFSEVGLGVTKALSDDRVAVNMTGLTSFGQAVLALEAGALYASLLMCRMMDAGRDSLPVIRSARQYTEELSVLRGSSPWLVLVGSIRNKGNVEQALASGAHLVTVPPQVLESMLDEPATTKVLEEFRAAAASG